MISIVEQNIKVKYQGIILILIMHTPLIIYMDIKVTVSTNLSDFLNRIFSPKLEQM